MHFEFNVFCETALQSHGSKRQGLEKGRGSRGRGIGRGKKGGARRRRRRGGEGGILKRRGKKGGQFGLPGEGETFFFISSPDLESRPQGVVRKHYGARRGQN